MLSDNALSIPRGLLFTGQVISTMTALYLQCQVRHSGVRVDLQILLYFYWTALNLGRGKHAATSMFYPLPLVLEPSLAGLDIVLQIVLSHLSVGH